MKKENIFLLVASLGIFPVALTYGLFQELFFGIDVNSIEMTNIFRATMGLYVAMGTFWLAAAFNNKYTLSALHSLIVFMSGLAAARVVSMLVDGTPNIVLVGYTVIEAVIAFSGYVVLKGSTNANFQQQNKVGAY
ncbi:DUF4345 family protein [Vibrio sp. D420a]|uniref:DUF4345 domain-containing protein n=1 Tax=Vibrio sp. D420a TaxID=2836895 RepID=UPI0025551D9D|nr:DUF4345 domain-containing protein [Vibrio sp. D420a]MDK9762376.1 DUF4345 family protein [Vibrio sp. D420a]